MDPREIRKLEHEYESTSPPGLGDYLACAFRDAVEPNRSHVVRTVAHALVCALRDGREWGLHLAQGIMRETLERRLTSDAPRDGASRISAERARHVAEEGWIPKHDDAHARGELAAAAACYAVAALGGGSIRDGEVTEVATFWGPEHDVYRGEAWPWDEEHDRRPRPGCSIEERQRALEKAGALCAAEWDRLERIAKLRSDAKHPWSGEEADAERPTGARDVPHGEAANLAAVIERGEPLSKDHSMWMVAAHALGERCAQLIDRRGSVAAGDEESARQLCRAFAEAYRRAVLASGAQREQKEDGA